MTKVSKLLEIKGKEVWTVGSTAPVSEALKLMAAKEIGALLVVSEGKVVGIFSERDFIRKVGRGEPVSLQTSVMAFMTANVQFVTPDTTLDECMAVMTAKRIRHLPVMEKDRLVGMVSIGDVIKEVIAEKEISIQSLENYIWINMI